LTYALLVLAILLALVAAHASIFKFITSRPAVEDRPAVSSMATSPSVDASLGAKAAGRFGGQMR